MKLWKASLISLLLLASNANAQSALNYGQLAYGFNAVTNAVTNGTAFAVPTGSIGYLTWCTSYGTAPASITVNLQVSNDNSTYTNFDTHSSTTATCRAVYISARFVRPNISAVSMGSTTTVTFVLGRVGTGTSNSSVRHLASGMTIPGGTVVDSNPLIDASQTWNDAADAFTGFRLNITNTASASTSRIFDWQLGGASLYSLDRFGVTLAAGAQTVASSGYFGWSASSRLFGATDGNILLQNNAGTAFGLLQFGGTTSAFPSLKRNAAIIQVRLADDSANAALSASTLQFTTAVNTGNGLLTSNTAPTISSGFGTTPTVTAQNGTAAFVINVGTGGTANAGVIALPAATTGWICNVNAPAAPTMFTRQTASTTTTATVSNYNNAGTLTAWAASTVLNLSCFAY